MAMLKSFNLGFVQGSGLGPTLFLVLAQDLNTLSGNNELIKFADDSTLFIIGPRELRCQCGNRILLYTGLGQLQ